MNDLYQQAKKEFLKADKVLLISHRKPDADTLGANIAISMWLKRLGKEVTLACCDKPANVFDFLPDVSKFVTEFNLKDFDLMLVADAGASYMTDFHLKYENIFNYGIPVINIDHHASNDNYGTINIVEPGSASTTLIVYRMFKEFGVEIDEKMALCLLSGIYGDTGSFMHSNTSMEVLLAASDLMKSGAKLASINKFLFGNKSVSALRLWGRVLENLKITDENVAISVVRENDYVETSSYPEQLSGVVDYLNMVPGIKFSVLINEDRKGHVKGSFRTKNDDVDLSKITQAFGGGGHPKAAGFSLNGRLVKDESYTIVTDDLSKKSLNF